MKNVDLTHPVIASSTDIKLQIMKLNAMREEQEIALKTDLKEIYYSLQLSTIIRRTVRDLSADPEIKTTAVQAGIGIGSSFLLDKLLFRKGAGIKSYLLNVGLKKLISYFASGSKISEMLQKNNH